MPARLSAEDITHRAMDCGAAQKFGEFVQLVALVRERKPRTVVEIGTMQGGTLYAWCQAAAHDAMVISIDLPGGRWGGGYDDERARFLHTFRRPGQRLKLVRGNSHDPSIQAHLLHILRDREIDLLFIDGDHTYEGAKRDFDDYSPHVASGGLIALHDILEHPQVPDCDVDQLWAEVHPQFARTWEFTVIGEERDYGPWGGIGVVEKP